MSRHGWKDRVQKKRTDDVIFSVITPFIRVAEDTGGGGSVVQGAVHTGSWRIQKKPSQTGSGVGGGGHRGHYGCDVTAVFSGRDKYAHATPESRDSHHDTTTTPSICTTQICIYKNLYIFNTFKTVRRSLRSAAGARLGGRASAVDDLCVIQCDKISQELLIYSPACEAMHSKTTLNLINSPI